MSVVSRTGIKTYYCINNVACNGVISPVFQNMLNESLQAIANTGETVASLNGGVVHGQNYPILGWARGRNYNKSDYNLIHPIEITPLYNKFALFARVKLGDRGGGMAQQWLNFYLREPNTTTETRLHEVRQVGYGPGTGITPVAVETVIDIVIIDDLPAWAIPPAGSAYAVNFRIHSTQYGAMAANGFNINSEYWAGCLHATLKLFRQC